MKLRKSIVNLAKVMSGPAGLMVKIDENAPEYYAFDCCLSDEQADIASSLGLRKMRSLDYVVKKNGKSKEETKKILDELADIGVIKSHVFDGEDFYFMQIFAPGTLEMMVGNKKNCEKHPEVGRAFEHYTRIRLGLLSPMLPVGTGPMRIIPIESAIETDSQAVDLDKISYYLDKVDTYAVTDCSCRSSRRMLGEGCGHIEKDMCLIIGTGAEYYIRTGKARQIDKEEFLAILKKAEENGLVHNMPNVDGAGETLAICNCCSCSCFALRTATMFKAPMAVASNYVAETDSEKCVACGQCVENCPTNALKLGQSLCSKTPIVTEKYDKIENTKWGEDKWNNEYRTNRENTVPSGTAPCKTACPAHIGVQGYIKLASQGRYTEALELIKKDNPLPAVCGRVCPHKCEDACTRGDIDSPVAIDEIKKFIADMDLNSDTRFVPEKKWAYNDGKKMAVVGSGPAGLSCAYYMAVDGYKVTVFEKEEKLGGMLTFGIPNFRLEKDVINAEIDVLRELGVEFKTATEVGKDITIEQLKKEGFEGFYLAIGAQAGRKIGIEGEDAEGVITGVDFLRNTALDKSDKISGNVVVIGGGNVAIDVARTAVRTDAASVNMYCLEKRDEMPALEEEIEEALEENISINNGYGPKKIVVENGKVVGVEFKKCISVFNSDGKFAPEYDEGDTITVPADYVLISVGQSIVWGDLLDGLNVELNRNNTIITDEYFVTGETNVIAGGDCKTGPKFAIDAIASGREGSISMHRSVWPGQTQCNGRDNRNYTELNKEEAIIDGYDNTKRQRPLHKTETKRSFKDTRVTFTEEQMKKESSRCLGCGAVQLDTYMCIGCGQCTTKCKFDAIKLVKRDKSTYADAYESLPVNMAKYTVKRVTKIAAKPIKKAFGGE